MSARLVLVGAGGLAREAAEAVRAAADHGLVGFVDDDPALWGTSVDGLPVLGGIDVVADHEDWLVALCPGSGAGRASLAARMRTLGLEDERYATVVHPTAVVPGSCTVGAGSVVLAGAVLTAGVTLGQHTVLMPGCVLTHDDVLDDFVTVCARVALAGDVHVAEGAYLGAGCLVREHVHVGAAAVVGMGAVVLTDVPAGEVWVGAPARRMSDTRGGAVDGPQRELAWQGARS